MKSVCRVGGSVEGGGGEEGRRVCGGEVWREEGVWREGGSA